MYKVDCLGEICPIPIMRLQKVMPQIRGGEPALLVADAKRDAAILAASLFLTAEWSRPRFPTACVRQARSGSC